MSRLFGLDVAKLVHANISRNLLPATLTKVTPGRRSLSDPTGGTDPTEVGYPCRGLVSDYSERERVGDVVPAGSRKVLLIAGSLPDGIVPEPNDKVTIEGAEYRIADDGVTRDPAGATPRAAPSPAPGRLPRPCGGRRRGSAPPRA